MALRDRRPSYRYRFDPPPVRRAKGNNDHVGHQRNGRDLTRPMPSDPYMPSPYDDVDNAAVTALSNGTATHEQQLRAIHWILFASRTYEDTGHPDPIIAARLSGTRKVGLEIIKLIRIKTSRQSEREQG